MRKQAKIFIFLVNFKKLQMKFIYLISYLRVRLIISITVGARLEDDISICPILNSFNYSDKQVIILYYFCYISKNN